MANVLFITQKISHPPLSGTPRTFFLYSVQLCTNFFLSFLGVTFFSKIILKTHSETLLFVKFQICMKKILRCPVHASAYIPFKSLAIKIILLYQYMKHLFKHFKIDSGGNKIMVFASLDFRSS